MKKFLKNKNNLYNCIMFGIVFLFIIINLYDLKHKLNSAVGIKYYMIFLGVTVFLCTTLFLVSRFNSVKDESKIPKAFLITSLILGTIFLLLSPLFTGSDEHNHYYRIYEITEGKLITPTKKYVGGKMPSSLQKTYETAKGDNTKVKYSDISKMKKIKLNSDKKKQYGDSWKSYYSNTALYSPLQYFPHIVGFLVGKTLNFGPYLIGMLGRLFNLIFYVLIGYLCLKIMPKFKMFYFLVLISPNMMQCATTLSADAFTNVIVLLMISYIYSICYRSEKIKIRDEIILFVLSIIIALCKIVYLPIVFLLLIIDKKKFNNQQKEKTIFIILTFVVSTIVSLLWMKTTSGVFLLSYDKTPLQKSFILNNPFIYLIILLKTFTIYIVKFIECLFVGTTMYHTQLDIPMIISLIYVLIVSLSLFNIKKPLQLKTMSKLLVTAIGLIIVVLISTAIYIQCTAQFFSVGNSTIEGIQGRYFIPVVLLIPFVINKLNMRNKINEQMLYNIAVSINLIVYFYMLNRFII